MKSKKKNNLLLKFNNQLNKNKKSNLLFSIIIFKSNKHLYVKIVNNLTNKTIISSSTKELKLSVLNKNTSFLVGENLGKKALNVNIFFAFFPKHNYYYHGCIKSFANGLRKQGLYC
jgi:large subunit ribosomal protein L18